LFWPFLKFITTLCHRPQPKTAQLDRTPLKLSQGQQGQVLQLLQAEATAELALLRLGLSLGETVQVLAKPPGGPLVLLTEEGLELALGRLFCDTILVAVQEPQPQASPLGRARPLRSSSSIVPQPHHPSSPLPNAT
jgi:Fe2+ transport system protein FeoA